MTDSVHGIPADQAAEPVRYVGSIAADERYHDGRLPPAVGTHTFQVFRANRRSAPEHGTSRSGGPARPDAADGFGWTYNHAPMLAHWKGTFYLEYLSNRISEHIAPGQTLLTTSPDGRQWSKPVVAFPPYTLPEVRRPDARLAAGHGAIMHQRMGFYVAPNGRLLILGFYGVCPHPTMGPNDGKGVGRVVREVLADGSFGPIYFLRLNRHAGWDESNVDYPMAAASPDGGFRDACEALLADRLVRLQMWEEDRARDGFFAVEDDSLKALSFYHRADGAVAAVWKWSKAALSADEGQTFTPVADVPSLVMAGAKVWGQRTSDGRYALVYNPATSNTYRWPLAIVTGDDGRDFDRMLCVVGEVPPRRFDCWYDRAKEYGPQYVRGIVEGNGCPPDGGLWVTYSMNKEDIWVSRIPVPVRGEVDRPVRDTFDDCAPGGVVRDWNVWSPRWAPVEVVEFPSPRDKSLQLRDEDPYDYAQAERVFPESRRVTVRCRLRAEQDDHGQLAAELRDRRGARPVRLMLQPDGRITAEIAGRAAEIARYAAEAWFDLAITIDASAGTFDVAIDGRDVLTGAAVAEEVQAVHRVTFRTGEYRGCPAELPPMISPDLPGADEPTPPAVFRINSMETTDHA